MISDLKTFDGFKTQVPEQKYQNKTTLICTQAGPLQSGSVSLPTLSTQLFIPKAYFPAVPNILLLLLRQHAGPLQASILFYIMFFAKYNQWYKSSPLPVFENQCDCNPITPTHLYIAPDYCFSTMIKLNTSDRYHIDDKAKNIYYLILYRESLPIKSLVQNFVCPLTPCPIYSLGKLLCIFRRYMLNIPIHLFSDQDICF